jgi:hypothetical protein
MKTGTRRVLTGLVAVVVAAVAAGAAYALVETSRFDASLDKVYDVPVPTLVASTDPVVVARGKHLVESVAACASSLCHGADLGGGRPIEMGPVMVAAGPNITSAGLGAVYADGEIARLVKHGIKKDGRSVRFMPVQDFDWLPDSDVVAIVSYLRVAPPVDRPNQGTTIKTLGKILDRQDKFAIDVARHIEQSPPVGTPPDPAPTAAYGAFLSNLCSGCHGEHLSGGPLPGAPPSMPIPLNLTPDASGLAGWTFEDFDKLMRQGIRKNGKTLDPFMPVESWRNFDDVEMHALWAHLSTLSPAPFGNR